MLQGKSKLAIIQRGSDTMRGLEEREKWEKVQNRSRLSKMPRHTHVYEKLLSC